MLLLMATAGLWLTCSTHPQRFNKSPRAPMGRHGGLPIPKSAPLPKQVRDDNVARRPHHGCPCRTKDPRGDNADVNVALAWLQSTFLGGSNTGIPCHTADRACQRAPLRRVLQVLSLFLRCPSRATLCVIADCGLLCPWPGASDGSSCCFL